MGDKVTLELSPHEYEKIDKHADVSLSPVATPQTEVTLSRKEWFDIAKPMIDTDETNVSYYGERIMRKVYAETQ